MKKNIMKARLGQQKTVVGCIVQAVTPSIVEILGLAGFHFVMIDVEHSSLSVSECERLVLAADARQITPLVRPPANNPKDILRYLDIGAQGIVIPDVKDRQDAVEAVKSVKYAPIGMRGLASTRGLDYGMTLSKPEALKNANDETIVIAIIESIEGVQNARDIFSVPGIDAAFIGTSDLSMSIGAIGKSDHPEVQEAVDKVLKIGVENDTPIGLIVRDGETPRQHFNRGISIAFTSVYSMLKKASRDFVDAADYR